MDTKRIFTNKTSIIIIAVICTLLWGSAYPAVKTGYVLFGVVSGDVPAKILFAGYRFSLAGIMVLIVTLITTGNIKLPNLKALGSLIILGITQTTLQYIFFYIGLANTSGVKASILNSTSTFFSVILAHFIYANDKINKNKLLGCILGFIGVILTNLSTELKSFNFTIYGDGFIILACVFFAIGSVYSKRAAKNMNGMLVTGYQLVLGGIILCIMGFSSGGRLTNFSGSSTLLLIYLAFLSATAFTLWTILLKYNSVSKISIFNFLVPIFGAMLSALFLGEKIFEIKNISALILVCVGIYIVNRKKD